MTAFALVPPRPGIFLLTLSGMTVLVCLAEFPGADSDKKSSPMARYIVLTFGT